MDRNIAMPMGALTVAIIRLHWQGKNLVNVGPVTLEFTRLIYVHAASSYVRLAAPLLSTAAISSPLCGAISTQFCFATIH